MNVRTVGKTLAAAAVFAVSLSACSNNQPAPQMVGNAGGGNVSSQTSESSSSTSDSSRSSSYSCSNEMIAGSFRQATNGHYDGFLEITNVSSKNCTLTMPYPSMEFMGRQGTPLDGLNYTQGDAPTGTVTLAPGELASSAIEWQHAGSDSSVCAGMAWAVNLSVDGQTTPKSIAPEGGKTFDVCGPGVAVGAWQKG